MALTPYPLPRSTRATPVLEGDGGSTYGPFGEGWGIFDVEDVAVERRLGEALELTPAEAFTVAKTVPSDPYSPFTVTFPGPVTAPDQFQVRGRRLHERELAISKGGVIDALSLELELAKQAVVLQELYRDIDTLGNRVDSLIVGVRVVLTLAALKSHPASQRAVYLLDRVGLRSGLFDFIEGDLSDFVDHDPLEGIHVAHATVPPQVGCWARRMDGRGVKPGWFGGMANFAANDSEEVQAAVDLIKFYYQTDRRHFDYFLDLDYRVWRVSHIDATNIRTPGFTIRNGKFYFIGTGQIGLDMGGSSEFLLEHVQFEGARLQAPKWGVACYRLETTPTVFPAAGNHRFQFCDWIGRFSGACLLNFASENFTAYACNFRNDSPNEKAVAVAVVDNRPVITQQIGAFNPTHGTTLEDADNRHASTLNIDLINCQFVRQASFILNVVNVTNTNPAVFSFDPAALAAAVADGDIANGDLGFTWVYRVIENTMKQMNGRTGVVGAIDTAAGTLTMAVDATAFDPFGTPLTSPRFTKANGSMLLLAGLGESRIKGYGVCYGAPGILWDFKSDDTGIPKDVEVDLQVEAHNPSGVLFNLPNTGRATLRSSRFNFITTLFKEAMFDTQTANNGWVQMENCKFTSATPGETAPAKLNFGNPQNIFMQHCEMFFPVASHMNPVAQFRAGSSGVVRFGDAPPIIFGPHAPAQPQRKVNTTGKSNLASTTVDPQLKAFYNAGERAPFEAEIFYSSQTVAGFRIGLSGPANSAYLHWVAEWIAPDGTAGRAASGNFNTTGIDIPHASGTKGWVRITGIFEAGPDPLTDAGDLEFRWGQAAADPSNTSVQMDSWFIKHSTQK